MARNGVQQLLTAEQEAQHIVNASRNGNCDFRFLSIPELLFYSCKLTCSFFSSLNGWLKRAKEEAEKENDQFRAQMEIDFQRKLAEVKTHK